MHCDQSKRIECSGRQDIKQASKPNAVSFFTIVCRFSFIIALIIITIIIIIVNKIYVFYNIGSPRSLKKLKLEKRKEKNFDIDLILRRRHQAIQVD